MGANAKLVRDFVSAWSRNNLDELMGYFTPDCVYHNIPLEPVKGLAAIRTTLHGFSSMASEVEWVLHQIGESEGGVVFTERTDRFKIGGKWVELPVMGSFELRDGKISAWRDYFDMQQFTKQLPTA